MSCVAAWPRSVAFAPHVGLVIKPGYSALGAMPDPGGYYIGFSGSSEVSIRGGPACESPTWPPHCARLSRFPPLATG